MGFHQMHTPTNLCILLVFTSISLIQCEEACTFIDYIEKDIEESDYCSNSKVCKNKGNGFTILYINTPPFTYDTLNGLNLREIEYIIRVCCGKCVRPSNITWSDSIKYLSMNDIESSDFVYPIMALSSTTKLYGKNYIPIQRLTKVLYVTKIKNNAHLLKKIFDLYPLLVVALLFAVISGFVAWIVETWINKEEFPRPFLIGWFEGFWWSFVSMTTVGYGDKSPRSVPARLFSVVWILIGLIVCGILTGELTGQIVSTNTLQPAEMSGKKVGVMHYRDFEAYVVAQNGGKVKRSDYDDNPMTDFVALTKMLKDDSIDGIAIEYETFFHIESSIEDAEGYELELAEFMDSKITTTEKTYIGESLSYGVLVRNETVYNYFKDYVIEASARTLYLFSIDNNMKKEEWNQRNKKLFSAGNSILFSSKSEYFIQTMIAIGIMFAFILIFGTLFEIQRKKNIFKRCGTIDVAT